MQPRSLIAFREEERGWKKKGVVQCRRFLTKVNSLSASIFESTEAPLLAIILSKLFLSPQPFLPLYDKDGGVARSL